MQKPLPMKNILTVSLPQPGNPGGTSCKRVHLQTMMAMVLFFLTINGWAQLVPFAENFSYATGNLVGLGGWTLQGSDITNPILVTTPGLFYPGYQSSGIGNAATLGKNATGQDLFNNFTGTNTINAGSVYISALVKVTAATRPGDYFLSFKETPNPGLTVFKGRLYAKDSLGTGNLVFGITKSTNNSSVPVNWTPTYYTFGATYLVVLKYTFIPDIANDVVDIYVFNPANPFPITEPASPNAIATDAGSDAIGQRCVQLRQGGLNSPNLIVDGIRVGQSWAEAVTLDITPPVAAFVPASGATNVITAVIPTITFNEPVRKIDGTAVADADLATLVTFKKSNSSGANVAFTATIDATKTIITVTPAAPLLNSQLYYLAVGPVEDGAGNESLTQSATFTTVGSGVSNDATLSDLKVDGTTVAGFAPATLSYSMSLPYGTTIVPTVTATPNYGMATMVITPAAAIPGTTNVAVTAEDGITQLTYSVTFTLAPPSNDATLKWIKWGPATETANKVLVTGFDAATLSYSITLPAEITAANMAALANFTPGAGLPDAIAAVTQPVNLTGTLAERTGTVLVTAQDGTTSITYTVIFTVYPATTFNFKEGFLVNPPTGWTPSANIGSTTVANNVGIYPGVTSPKFKWVTPTDGGTLTTGANNTAGRLEFFVKVLDNQPANNLHLYIEKSYDNTVWTLVSQDPMPLTGSTSNWHQVILTLNDDNSSLYLRFRASATNGNNSTGLFYLDDISLTSYTSADASLSDLKVDGVTVAGFASNILNYNFILAPGTTVVPVVTATPAQPTATKIINSAPAIPGITTVIVTAPNGMNTMTYSVNFSHALVAPANLDAAGPVSGAVNLSWTDPNYNETGTNIERRPASGLFSLIGTVGADVTTYTDIVSQPLNPDLFVPADRFSAVSFTSGVKFADVINYKGVPTSLYLDVYEPTGDNTMGRPMIIWIHGGGFRTDSYRTQGYIVDYCNRFAKRGYVCISIDYRLREAIDMPTQASEYPALQDAARDANAAIDWVRAHAATYHIDPNLIFVAGGSAGGRTTQTVCQFNGPDPTALYPPENLYLTAPWNKTGLVANATLWGGLEPEMRGWVYPYLQPYDSPTVLVHGSADVTILPQYSIDLDDTLTSTGVTNELHIIQGATHSCLGHETEISAWVAAFFAQEWKMVNCEVTSYTYRVRAFNSFGNSPYSNIDSVTVSSLPAAAGSISGPTTVEQGQTGVAYSIPAIQNATGYSWTLPSGASITSGSNANSIVVSFSPIAVSGIMTVKGTNSCGNGPASPNFNITVTVPVPALTLLANVVVLPTETKCYNATQTITVAGNGSTFVMQAGAHATMIAGQNILFRPGTTIQAGAYLWGHITTNSTYCGIIAGPSAPITAAVEPGAGLPKPGFKVYPNPTPGMFTLEMSGNEKPGPASVAIFKMTGERLMTQTLNGGSSHQFSLEGQPAGIYILRIMDTDMVGTVKIIKQ